MIRRNDINVVKVGVDDFGLETHRAVLVVEATGTVNRHYREHFLGGADAQIEERLKTTILHKLYGDILARLLEVEKRHRKVIAGSRRRVRILADDHHRELTDLIEFIRGERDRTEWVKYPKEQE